MCIVLLKLLKHFPSWHLWPAAEAFTFAGRQQQLHGINSLARSLARVFDVVKERTTDGRTDATEADAAAAAAAARTVIKPGVQERTPLVVKTSLASRFLDRYLMVGENTQPECHVRGDEKMLSNSLG